MLASSSLYGLSAGLFVLKMNAAVLHNEQKHVKLNIVLLIISVKSIFISRDKPGPTVSHTSSHTRMSESSLEADQT